MHLCRIWSRASIAGASAFLISSAAHAQDLYGERAGSGAFGSAIGWLEGTLLGTVASVAAVIAVATVGLMMLAGRMDVRHAVRVVLGCFIIFGASTIASGLVAAMSSSPGDPGSDAVEQPVLAAQAPAVPVNSVPAVSDPYAGAAVPPR